MTVKSYEIDAEQRLLHIAPAQAAERSQQPDSMLWMDVEESYRS